ncbi:hypothetical protein ACIPJK_23940 [Streptomyces roseus]|uniref:hypothetical protein n=1 Tax=Streptomyces roseus TaxID=66430 RepID=UPI00382474F5
MDHHHLQQQEDDVPVDAGLGRVEGRRVVRRADRRHQSGTGSFIFLMVADYGPEVSSYEGTRAACRGPFVDPSPQDRVCRGDELRQWPALLGILALASLVTVTAAATMVYAKVLSRLSRSAGTDPSPQNTDAP